MNRIMKRSLPVALALAVSFLLVPDAANAQEPGAEQQQTCTAQLSPQSVESGQAAVSVTANLSGSIGEVDDVKAPEESGVSLASQEDLQQRTEMARGGEGEAQPIEMAATGNGATIFLNTQDATAGTYEITLTGAEGECSGQLTVGGGQQSTPPGQ